MRARATVEKLSGFASKGSAGTAVADVVSSATPVVAENVAIAARVTRVIDAGSITFTSAIVVIASGAALAGTVSRVRAAGAIVAIPRCQITSSATATGAGAFPACSSEG